jgi:hypothetical protein
MRWKASFLCSMIERACFHNPLTSQYIFYALQPPLMHFYGGKLRHYCRNYNFCIIIINSKPIAPLALEGSNYYKEL